MKSYIKDKYQHIQIKSKQTSFKSITAVRYSEWSSIKLSNMFALIR